LTTKKEFLMKIHILGKVMRVFADQVTKMEIPEGIEMMKTWVNGKLVEVRRKKPIKGGELKWKSTT